MTEFEKFKKKNYPPKTPDWLIKLVKQAFDCGVKAGQKACKKNHANLPRVIQLKRTDLLNKVLNNPILADIMNMSLLCLFHFQILIIFAIYHRQMLHIMTIYL